MTAGSVAVPTIIPLKAPQGPKHLITSNTAIELRSDTDCSIVLYTVDNSRPEATFKHGRLNIPKTTFLYKEPFLLPTGRVYVKALAMSKDAAKQSSVVTKRFTVYQEIEATNNESEDEQTLAPVRSPSPRPPISYQLKHRLSMSSRASLTVSQISPPGSRPSGHQSGQISPPLSRPSDQRPVTAEKPPPCCVYCKAPRPKAVCYKYCTHCGGRLPPLVISAVPLQLSVCSQCRAELPPEATTCVVCEGTVLRPTSIQPILGQSNTSTPPYQEELTCLHCGTSNSRHLTHCVTCEGRVVCGVSVCPPPHLPHPPLPQPAIMRPHSGSSYMLCGVCGRINVSDARFCDWCGSKPEGCELSVLCAACSTGNEWSARHCYSCGSLIKAPLRPEVELAQSMKMPAIAERDKNTWIPVVEIADKGPELSTVGTQTAGIFYPSSTSLHQAEQRTSTKKTVYANTRDRLPQLQQHSPGNGLWRVAVQHVCAHLRAHTQSSTQLQTQIGGPQLGKLVEATAEQNKDHFNLQLTFGLPESGSTSLHQATPTSHETAPPKQSTNNGRRLSTVKRLKSELLLELSASGQGRPHIIQQQGVDVNTSDVHGLPLLSLAARNGHMKCISVLVESGALVNATHKYTGNTALHEAVVACNVHCVEALLGYSADPRQQNKQGLNPCELAIKLNFDELVSCFATYVGIGLLDKIRTQPSLTL